MLRSHEPATRIGLLILSLCLSLDGPALSQTSLGVSEQPGAASAIESGRKVLDRTLIEITHENNGKPNKPMIFLIGENHASIKVQKQCAQVIEHLYDAGMIEAILVEGSEGPFNHKPTADKVTEAFSAEQRHSGSARYWREQLEQGLIAGYEYVALTRPSIPVFGVEDMEAKCRHELRLSTLTVDDVTATIAHWRRGAALLEATIGALEAQNFGSATLAAVKEDVIRYRTAINRLQETLEGLIEDLQPQLNTLREGCEWRALLGRHRDFLDWIARYHEHTSKPYTGSEATVGELEKKIERYSRDHEQEMPALLTVLQELEEKAQEKGAAERELEVALKRIQGTQAEVQDAYFIAANHVRVLGESHGLDCTKVANFFRDESEILEKESLARSAKDRELQVRDEAMVTHALRFMTDNGKKRAVLVVGVAHLEDVASKLRAEHVSFIGGALAASHDDVEAWEVDAMRSRWRSTEPLFDVAGEIPPETRLKDEGWKREQAAVVEYFRRSSLQPTVDNLAGGGRIFEGPRKATVVYCANDVDAVGGRVYEQYRSAIPGEHVMRLGKVPGEEGRFYVAYDRGKAKDLVSELSGGGDVYVYVYQTLVGGRCQRRFITPNGEQSLKEFLQHPPLGGDGQAAKRVVLFGEPDEVQEHGRIESPIWGQLLGVGGAGGGDRPPGGGWGPPSVPPNETESSHTGVFATINPRRAAEKSAILDHQELEYVAGPEFVDEQQLDNFIPPFTPRRGDHGQMVFIIAHNTAEFRRLLDSKAKWFENKQVGLILCGTAYNETEALKEKLLQEGAIMVWAPGQIITPEQARRLKEEIQKIPPLQRSRSLKDLINRALWNWRRSSPDDPNRRVFDSAKAQVRVDRVRSDVSEA